MNVSSYLEGFLTVYGWMIYDTLYQLFSMTWIVFLPFLMLFFNYFKESVTDNMPSGFAQFKSILFSFGFMLLTVITCLVPLDKITIKEAKINSICVKGKAITEIYGDPKSQFTFKVDKEGKVPLVLSLIMRTAQGVNNVIYLNFPCVANVKRTTLAYDSTKITDPAVKQEADQFLNQCVAKAQQRLQLLDTKLGQGKSGQLANVMEDESRTNMSAQMQVRYGGSDLMLLLMEGGHGYQSQLRKAFKGNSKYVQYWQDNFSNKLYSAGPVEGLPPEHPDASENQVGEKVGPVTCKSWWTKRLRNIILNSAFDSFLVKIGGDINNAGGRKCRNVNDEQRVTCQEFLKWYGAQGNDDRKEFGDKLIYNTQQHANGFAALDKGEDTALKAATTVSVIGSIVGMIFPNAASDIFQSITGSAVGFYAQMFMYKVIAKFLLPFLMMSVYALWAFYMIVSSYKGETVFRGLVLIFTLSLIPSMWAVIEHLDSYLFQAMFPDNDVIERSTKGSSVMERMILDGATTAFYIVFPFVLFYLIAEAGGPRADKASQGMDNSARDLSNKSGNSTKEVIKDIRVPRGTKK